MARYESTFEVAAAPEAVASYLADVSRSAAWDPSIVDARATDPAGARYRVVVGFYGRRLELDYVVEQDDPTRVVLQGRGDKLDRRDTFTIEPQGAGSRVTFVSELKLKGVLRVLDRGLQVSLDGMGARAAKGLEAELAA